MDTIPLELKVSAQILTHKYGIPAKLVFGYLLAMSRMRVGVYSKGYISVTRATLCWLLLLPENTMKQGLHALEEIGLVKVVQQGHGAHRAKLLYQPSSRGAAKPKEGKPGEMPESTAQQLGGTGKARPQDVTQVPDWARCDLCTTDRCWECYVDPSGETVPAEHKRAHGLWAWPFRGGPRGQ